MIKKSFAMLGLVFLMILVTVPVSAAGSASGGKKPVSFGFTGRASVAEALDVQDIGSFDIPGGARSVRVWGNYAYIIDRNKEVRVIDVSNPSSPHQTGSIIISHPTLTTSAAEQMEILGRYAYVSNGAGFRVIDIKNPSDLKDIGGYENLSGTALAVKGNYVFTAENFNTEMYIIDVSNPAFPVKIGSYKPQKLAFTWQIKISGHYAYLYGYNQTIEIVDISSPDAPVFAGNFLSSSSINQPKGFAYHVSGYYLYTAVLTCLAQSCSHYFSVYDVSNPGAVQELGNYKISSATEATGIRTADPYVFLANGDAGIRVVDTTNPASPSEVGTFYNTSFVNDVYLMGGYIYAIDYYTGLKIFKMASSPTVKITNLVSGQYIMGTVDVQVVASSSAGIDKIEFFANDQKQNECSSSVYTFDWNSNAYPDGNYKLSVVAADKAHRTAAYEIFVVKDGSLPEIAVNRTHINFGAVEQGAAPAAQDLFIDNSGGGTLNWTADGPEWLHISPASGEGNATLALTADPATLSAGTYNRVLTISDPRAYNSPVTVNVTFTIYPAGSSAVPFGYFESPGDGDTVMSSIPVTGWCLDDIGVESVKIYRDPVPGEGASPVYIGDTIFIEGARPDLELSYPQYPFNYKGGWGYMMLTNFLPNGGNGTFTLYAIAQDREGHQVTLGSKTITCDNAHAVKPFGAIDTPEPGGSAAGSNYMNYAWALTPLPNTIPFDGSTIKVYVSGRPLGNPAYNVYREDVASLFPGYNNSNGAHGYYFLDTLQFQNGLHTIAWVVTDNAGNSDAIGSRYFTIKNTGTANSQGTAAAVSRVNGSMHSLAGSYLTGGDTMEIADSGPVTIEKGWDEDGQNLQEAYPDDSGNIMIEIRELERIVIYLEEYEVEDNVEPCVQPIVSNIHLTPKTEHLTLKNTPSHRYQGFLSNGDELKPLPIGSTFDGDRGVFYWQPGPGFIGAYTLVFTVVNKDFERITQKITIRILPKFFRTVRTTANPLPAGQ